MEWEGLGQSKRAKVTRQQIRETKTVRLGECHTMERGRNGTRAGQHGRTTWWQRAMQGKEEEIRESAGGGGGESRRRNRVQGTAKVATALRGRLYRQLSRQLNR